MMFLFFSQGCDPSPVAPWIVAVSIIGGLLLIGALILIGIKLLLMLFVSLLNEGGRERGRDNPRLIYT